jgi:hypothetical protein
MIRAKMELNHNIDRLCRSTTEPSVNLTQYKFVYIKLIKIKIKEYQLLPQNSIISKCYK